ncbi:hypothetical protein [Clostridium sp. DMHC 10]|uniref:hypothetical protein n=1 Tax=Clostridium sp. DMHC 10 TaxID=747377 RepID=UPI000ADABA2E|nr:hypothetical protein [Clostridium sp. DMHC 10]
MELKKSYKMLLVFSMLLLFAVVAADTSLVKSIAGIGGGFLDKSVQIVTGIGGGFL